MVEVQIEEMYGSDRSRPKDYGRAVVVDTGPKNTTNKETLRGEWRGMLKKGLTGPTLLEMSGYPTNQELATLLASNGISGGRDLVMFSLGLECVFEIRRKIIPHE